MVIESRGFELDQFYFPPFDLKEGELLNLYVHSGGHFFDLESKLVDIFSGKEKVPQVTIYQPMHFVENFYEFRYRRFLLPVTVSGFLKKAANPEQISRITSAGGFDIKPNTPLIALSNYERRLIALLAASSRSENLIFDLVGIDPVNAISFLERMKKMTAEGASAILINNFGDDNEKSYCDKNVEIEIKEVTSS
ncbi:hypothetical protein WBG78_14025 [Chryseolinea sp. T2]|uniref:hypothetical protein n=1 Tax=Chryseolinea sp. T2 TaxID=3129255 RepID=UPI0030779A12